MGEIEDYLRTLQKRGPKTALRELRSRFTRGDPKKTLNHLLDVLDGLGIKATFFVVGYTAYYNQDMINKILSYGHEIGCHGFFHNRIDLMNAEQLDYDVKLCVQLFKKYFSYSLKGYRAPYLKTSPFLPEVLERRGFNYSSSQMGQTAFSYQNDIMEYPVRYDDYDLLIKKRIGVSHMFSHLKDNLHSGEVLVLHPFRMGQKENIGEYKMFLKDLGKRYEFKPLQDYNLDSVCITGDIGELSNKELLMRMMGR